MPRIRLLVLLAGLAMAWGGGVLAQGPAPDAAAQLAYPATERPAEIVLFQGEAQLEALAARGPTVLFFFAAWCPNCQAAVREFQTRWDDVRPGLTLVIADYDTERALKARFGVTYQDTYVQVAPDGSRVGIWNGGGVDGLNGNTLGL